MLFLDRKSDVRYIDILGESQYPVEAFSTFRDGKILVIFLTPDDGTGMKAMIGFKTKFRKPVFKMSYLIADGTALIVKNKCKEIKRCMGFICTKITGFINKYAELVHLPRSCNGNKNGGEHPRRRWTRVLRPARFPECIISYFQKKAIPFKRIYNIFCKWVPPTVSICLNWDYDTSIHVICRIFHSRHCIPRKSAL